MSTTRENMDSSMSPEDRLVAQKIVAALKTHKQKLKRILIVCHSIDIILISLLVLPPNTTSADHNEINTNVSYLGLLSNYSLTTFTRVLDVRHDSLDSAVILALRLLFLWKLTQLSIKWGHPTIHAQMETNKEKKQEFENSKLFR